MDIPMFLYALEHKPVINAGLLKAITPVAPVRVDAIFYKVNVAILTIVLKSMKAP